MAKNYGSNTLQVLVFVALLVVASFVLYNFQSSQNQPNPPVQCSPCALKIDAFFCPQDNCSQKLVSQFDSAKTSIDGAIYSFTLDSIGNALVDAENRGVKVRILMEKQQLSDYSELDKLKAAGIEVKIDSNPAYMHDKFAVIDGKIVATGSFNWSQNADEKNNENLVIIESTDLAEKFESEFEKIFSKGLSD